MNQLARKVRSDFTIRSEPPSAGATSKGWWARRSTGRAMIGLGGADGGIDLVLRRDGRRVLVQCKQWRRRRVPVNVVREMYGLLLHHGADEVQIATVGGFTRDAERFASGKPIRLIDGQTLLTMIRSVQESEPVGARHSERIEPVLGKMDRTSSEPTCPRCNEGMVRRTSRRDGSAFWGCSAFPRCRATRTA